MKFLAMTALAVAAFATPASAMPFHHCPPGFHRSPLLGRCVPNFVRRRHHHHGPMMMEYMEGKADGHSLRNERSHGRVFVRPHFRSAPKRTTHREGNEKAPYTYPKQPNSAPLPEPKGKE